MPLYEYLCQDCGHRFEVLQRMGEGGRGLACPGCGRRGVERQLSTFASAETGRSGSRGRGMTGGSGFG